MEPMGPMGKFENLTPENIKFDDLTSKNVKFDDLMPGNVNSTI